MSTNNNTTKQNRTATERRITLSGTEFIIMQPSIATTANKWGKDRFKHLITIKANGTSKRFTFYGSEVDYRNNKHRLTKDDLVDVLGCVIDDGISGTLDCKEFFSEFGYSDDPCEGLKVYKACKDTFRRLDDMGITEDMLYDMSNEIHELED